MKGTIIVFILCSIYLVVGYIKGYGEGKREMLKALNDYKNDERELKREVTGMRLINADRFKSVMLDEPTEWMTEEQLVQFRAMIDLAPTVDAVPVVHGRWKMVEGELAFWDMCSECGRKIVHRTPYYDFCPNCGADMRKKHGRNN